jgi:FKBP-type peptidyl-prolyl cis-trans isomerase 2
MNRAKIGDRVRVQCLHVSKTGSIERKPPKPKTVEFTVGGREVVSGLSLGVEDMATGDRKHLVLQPHDAYGPVQQCLIREVSRRRFSKQNAIHVGSG